MKSAARHTEMPFILRKNLSKNMAMIPAQNIRCGFVKMRCLAIRLALSMCVLPKSTAQPERKIKRYRLIRKKALLWEISAWASVITAFPWRLLRRHMQWAMLSVRRMIYTHWGQDCPRKAVCLTGLSGNR